MPNTLKYSRFVCYFLASLFLAACEERSGELEVILTEGTNLALAVSPDQQEIVIDLQGTLWLLPIEGGVAAPLTDPLLDAHEPSWSPDGETIAFHAYIDHNYQICTIDKNGSNFRQLTSGPFDHREATFHPSGSTLIFSSDRDGNYDVFELDLNTQQVSAMTDSPVNEYYPSYDPAGERIYYVSDDPDAPGIYWFEVSSQATRILVELEDNIYAPSISPSSQQLVFSAFDGDTIRQYLCNMGSGQLSLLKSGEDIFPFRVSWLDETRFLYTADGLIREYAIGDRATRDLAFEAAVRLDRAPYQRKVHPFDDTTAHPPLGILGPVLSPGGNSLAFTALGDLYLHEINENRTSKLTDDAAVDIDPDWSPDGSKLAFVSDRRGKMDLWIRHLDSSSAEQITDEDQIAAFPSWNHDGTRIAFFLRDPRNVWGYAMLHVMDIETREVNPIPGSYFVPGKPSWSADGKYIAFMALHAASSRYREGISQVFLVDVDDHARRQWSPLRNRTTAMRNFNGPAWSRDGRSMAFVQDGLLWTMDVNQEGEPVGAPRQLTDYLAASPSWGNQDQELLFIATDHLEKLNLNTGEIITVTPTLTYRRQGGEKEYVVHAGRVFTGTADEYLLDQDIYVVDNRITKIVPHQEQTDYEVIDASAYTVIPGLFEGHSHSHASVGEKLGRIWLAYGITSVREPGTDPYDALERKEAWTSGRRQGPREFFTGGLTDGSRIFYGLANSVVSEEHLQMELLRAKKLNYDLIKTYVRLPDPMQRQIIEAAHEMGVPASSHEIYPAAKYNMDATEHTSGTSRRGYSPKQTNLRRMYGDVVDLLAASGMFITPTIGLQGPFFDFVAEDENLLEHPPYVQLYSTYYRDLLLSTIRTRPSTWLHSQNLMATVYKISQAGGKITAGTDVPFVPFGLSLHVELQLYQQAGLSPFQVLQTATINAAESLGVENDLGTVEPGKLADFVVVDGDPLSQVKDAMNVVMTVKDGMVYRIEDLLDAP